MSCSVNVQQIIGPLNTLVIERQQDAGDPGSITTTNIIISNDVLQQIEVVDICRGTQGPSGPPGIEGPVGPSGLPGSTFDILPIVSGGTNNNSFNADYIIYYDGSNDQLASSNYTIDDIIAGAQALTGIVEGSGLQKTDLGNSQIRLDTIVGDGLDVHRTTNAIFVDGTIARLDDITPGLFQGILPVSKGGTANTSYLDGKLITFDSSALNGSGQFISASNLNADEIVVSGNGFTLAAGSGLVNGGFVIIPNGTGRIDIPESADITVFSDSFELSLTGTAGTYTKVTTDSKGRVESGGQLTPADIYNILGYIPWHSGNDGCGSKLDADMLCGQSGDYYLNATNITGIIDTGVLPDIMTDGRYTKVDVNTKGLVTSGMQMTPQDIENILGYDPVSPTGGVDFCGDIEIHGSLFINEPTGCGATAGLLRVYDNLPLFARNNGDISPVEPRGVSFVYGGGFTPQTGSIAYFPTEDVVYVTTSMQANQNGIDGGDSDDDFTDDINGGDAGSTFPISNLTGTKRLLLYKDTADELYVSRTEDQIVAGFKTFVDGIGVNDQVIIYDKENPTVPPTNVGNNTLLNINFNADLLDGQHGNYYLDAGNITGTFDASKVTFPFIQGTKHYIPKFVGDNIPANSIEDSVMYEQANRDIIVGSDKNLVVGADQNSNQQSVSRNVLIGTDNTVSQTSNSLLVGDRHFAKQVENVILAGYKASGLSDNSIAFGKYGTTWLQGQMAHGAYRADNSQGTLIEHGQASDFMMYLEGQLAVNWTNLVPSVQLPDDTTLAFKVSLLMNSAFSTGVAEFEFYSGIVKNVKLRNPNDITQVDSITKVMQQPKKNEIYNNSHVHDYYLQLLCVETNEIQNETIRVNDPPIDLLPVVIDNEPETVISKYEDPDGYNASYFKDNLGNLSITIDPSTITGNYISTSAGDLLVYCNDHGLEIGEYTYIEFTSHNQVSFPDDRYLVKAVVDEDAFLLEALQFRAEKQTLLGKTVLTLLPDDIRSRDEQNSVYVTGIFTSMDNGFRRVVNMPTYSQSQIENPNNYDIIVNQKNIDKFYKTTNIDSHLRLSSAVTPNPSTGNIIESYFDDDTNRFYIRGHDVSQATILAYNDYTYELFRKANRISVSGIANDVPWIDNDVTTQAVFVAGKEHTYTELTPFVEMGSYTTPITSGGVEVIPVATTGLALYLNSNLGSITDGDIVNVSASHTESQGTVKVRKRQRYAGSYQRIAYDPNELIDCVYTLYPSNDPSLPSRVEIFAEDYEDLGLLDNPYEFILYNNNIGTNDNNKFEIITENNVSSLYTKVDMPTINTVYEIEVQGINVYDEPDITQRFNISVSELITSSNNEKGLDSIALTNTTISTGTLAGSYVGTISGIGGYNPYVIFEQGYNSANATFVSGSDMVSCTGITGVYSTTNLIGEPCAFCVGLEVLADYNLFSVPERTLTIQEIYCETGLGVCPLFGDDTSTRFLWSDASSVGKVFPDQKFSLTGEPINYAVTTTGLDGGFLASKNLTAEEEETLLKPNITWIEYTGLPTELYAWPSNDVDYTTNIFSPSGAVSGLQKDVGLVSLDFQSPITGLVLWFKNVSAVNAQDGYITQEDSFKIATEDNVGFIKNDSFYSNSGLLVADRPFAVLDSDPVVFDKVADNILPFSGSSVDLIVCMTGEVSGVVEFSILADVGTNYQMAIGELTYFTLDSSENPILKLSEVYEDTFDNIGGTITYTGTPIESGNLVISGVKEGPVFRNCQSDDSDGIYGYETQASGLCYITGECQVYSAKVGPEGQGEAVYQVTFPEQIHISYTDESYIQLSSWTPTDNNPDGEILIVPSDGHYPITEVSGITNTSFLIPEQYAIALPVIGTGLSAKGTVSGSFDYYHQYQKHSNSIINQLPGDFLTIDRTYNPPVTNANFKPKNDLFDILNIQGDTIITEDTKNYVLIEDNRPPYLDHTIKGIYINDCRDFYANTKAYGNRLIDLRFVKDQQLTPANTHRELPYADGPWAFKDLHVGADYDHVNKRLVLFNLPTGIYKPMDRVQISFQNLNDIVDSTGLCSEPQYYEFPADHTYVYTGLPVTEFESDGVGDIQFTISDQPPEGWIKLDGSTYNINTYPALKQYLDYYRLKYVTSTGLCWSPSTVPDFRNASPVGKGEVPWNNLGDAINSSRFSSLLAIESSEDYNVQPVDIVGQWIMKAKGSFFDPNIPINLGDSGNINYVINDFDLGPNTCNGSEQISFSTTGCRIRIDILQFLEPDLRFNSELGTNEIYQVSGITHSTGVDYSCIDQPLSNMTGLYTPLNPVSVKPRIVPQSYTYSVVVPPQQEILNFETDSGVLGLYTKEQYIDFYSPDWHWWPYAIYVQSETGDEGPLSTPVQFLADSDGSTSKVNPPEGDATKQSPMIIERDTNVQYTCHFRNDSYGTAEFYIAASGSSYSQTDAMTVKVFTYNQSGIEVSDSCFTLNLASENSDGYIISDGSGLGQAFDVPSFGELMILWTTLDCTDTPIASADGEIEFTIYGVPYTSSQGTSYLVDPSSDTSKVQTDFYNHASGKFDLQLYQLPSVNIGNNVCGSTDQIDQKWFTHAHKMYINNFNTPRSYLEYGDEFKLIKIGNETSFGNDVTNLLTKINPTSEDYALSGLSTSDQLCRYIPCQNIRQSPEYNSWRYPTIWGVSEIKSPSDFPFYKSLKTGPQPTTSSVTVGDFPGNEVITTYWSTFGDGDYTISISNGQFVLNLDQDNPTGSIDVDMGGNQPYFFVNTTLPGVNPDDLTATWIVNNPTANMPKPWTDPLVAYANLANGEWKNTTYGNIKQNSSNIHYLPAEWCNTGQYEDRYRSVKPLANNLATQMPWTGTCEFSQNISGRMYIPENNNLYFHTYGGTTAYWNLDENGSGVPHQQTGIYIIGTDTSSSTLNSCGSGLFCIEISGFNNVDITGIPTVGDRESIGSNPIVIESNGVTGIVGNYGANKQFYFDFDDGLPQLSNIYNVIDYLDGKKKIVISAPYLDNLSNKSGLVFMIDNPKNIKSHLNPNLDNEFITSEPTVTPEELFSTQINHFDYGTKRWKHLLHYDWDVIGTGYHEIDISTVNQNTSIDLYPIAPAAIEISGIKYTKRLTEPFVDFDSLTVNNETNEFYLQIVTLNGQPAFTEDIYQDLPKVTLSGIQDIEYDLNPVTDITNYHGSGWNIGIKVNRTNEIINGREITARAEDVTGRADRQFAFSQEFLPELIQSYTGYALPSQSTWSIVYDTRNLDLDTIGNGVLEFEMQGVYDTNPSTIVYQKIRDNVLRVTGPVDPAVNTLTYYNAEIVAKTGLANTQVAGTTGLLVDLQDNSDWTPLQLTFNNFNSLGSQSTSGNFYIIPTGEVLKFDIPQPQTSSAYLSITHLNQQAVSTGLGYLISAVYNGSERRFNVTMTPTGADGNYYSGEFNRFPNNQLDVEISFLAWDNQQIPITPNPLTEEYPIFNTTVYTGLLLSNSSPETIQYYNTDEPWSILVKVSGGVTDHDPTNPPNLRVFNAPNEGSYEKPKEPVDCILSYSFQNDPSNTCWLVQANARRDVFGNYMPNETGIYNLYVNVDDGLTDYSTLNNGSNQNDQFTIIYNKPSGFINLPPTVYSVPSAPFFTKCDVTSNDSGHPPIIEKTNQSDPGFNLVDEESPGLRYDEDFPLWQQGYRGITSAYQWDAKVDISDNGLITTSVKGLGSDKVMSIAKIEFLEIESDQLVSVPFRIKDVAPAEAESEQFGQEGIIVEQGKAWTMTVTTEGGLADPRYPPTILLTGMPTFCTGFNPMDSQSNDGLACLVNEPSFGNGEWTYQFSGEPSCDLLGVKPFGILAIDTLTGIPPQYFEDDTHLGKFIYETGEFFVLDPEIQFTGRTELYPNCDTCYTGYVDFGPTLQDDLDCNSVTGIKTITVSGDLPPGLDYNIYMPTSTYTAPVNRGPGNPTGGPANEKRVTLPAPWNNLASGYIMITGCPTEFADGADYAEEFFAEVCNAVDSCASVTIQFEDASEPFEPNVDIVYFFGQSGAVLTKESGEACLGGGDEAAGGRAPNAQEYNVECQSVLPHNLCKTYLVAYSGLGSVGSLVSGIYPEGIDNSEKIDLEPNPNNYVYFESYDNTVNNGRHIAELPTPSQQTEGWEIQVDMPFATTVGTGLLVVEKSLVGGLKLDKMDEYFPSPFEPSTTKCIMGGGYIGPGSIPTELTKIGVRGNVLPRMSGYLDGSDATFTTDDQYMSGLTFVEVNADTDIPLISIVTASDCWQTGEMRISGVIPPPIEALITDPPPAANTNYSSLTDAFSFFTRFAYGTSATQQGNPLNQRQELLIYEVYNLTTAESIDNGTVTASSSFDFTPVENSGAVYSLHLYKNSDEFPNANVDLKITTDNFYTWIHKGVNANAAPNNTSFPPIFPTGFGSGVFATVGSNMSISGIAYGGYTIPTAQQKNLMVQSPPIGTNVPPVPYWSFGGSDWSNSQYLPQISGMVLSPFITTDTTLETTATIAVNQAGNTDVITIPVTDDYIGNNGPLNVSIYQNNGPTQPPSILLEYTFLVQSSNLLGSPVTGIEFDSPINWIWGSSQSATLNKNLLLASGIRTTSGGFDSELVLYQNDETYNIGDIVLVDSPSGTSSMYTACNDIDLEIIAGDSESIVISGPNNNVEWHQGYISPNDQISLYLQEPGEIYISPTSISSSQQGTYEYEIIGTPVALYKDYTFRIVTCENANMPVCTDPSTNFDAKQSFTDYPLLVSKSMTVASSSVTGTKDSWEITIEIEGGKRPVQNNSPRVLLKYGSTPNGTLCGFDRVIDRVRSDNVLLDEYDAQNDRIIIKLKANDSVDWAQSNIQTVVVNISDETGEINPTFVLP